MPGHTSDLVTGPSILSSGGTPSKINTVIWRSRLARSRAVSNVAPSEINAMMRPGYRALNLHERLVIADPPGEAVSGARATDRIRPPVLTTGPLRVAAGCCKRLCCG